jgi:hypothetical protein
MLGDCSIITLQVAASRLWLATRAALAARWRALRSSSSRQQPAAVAAAEQARWRAAAEVRGAGSGSSEAARRPAYRTVQVSLIPWNKDCGSLFVVLTDTRYQIQAVVHSDDNRFLTMYHDLCCCLKALLDVCSAAATCAADWLSCAAA